MHKAGKANSFILPTVFSISPYKSQYDDLLWVIDFILKSWSTAIPCLCFIFTCDNRDLNQSELRHTYWTISGEQCPPCNQVINWELCISVLTVYHTIPNGSTAVEQLGFNCSTDLLDTIISVIYLDNLFYSKLWWFPYSKSHIFSHALKKCIIWF